MSLSPDKVGLFLRSQAEELERIWRDARAASRPDVFPGLIDGLVAPFFLRAGELLGSGAAPEEVWQGLVGIVRWAPALEPDELKEEWALLVEVLVAACESVNASRDAADWLARAASSAAAGTAALVRRHGKAPEGVVTAVVFSSVSPRQPGAERPEA